jgi:E3 ubiquitin-protein ligase SIAH1
MAESLEKEFGTINLKEHLECPVCLELPKSPPIYQCPNGHIICNLCHTKLQSCPQCREPLGKYRCRIAEELMAFDPCPFAKHGCTDKFATNFGHDHKEKCPYREVYCTSRHCYELVSIK